MQAERADAWSVLTSVFGRGPVPLCSLCLPELWQWWFSWGEWCWGTWLGTWCLGLPVDVCKVRSNGSEGSILLRPISGGGTGLCEQGVVPLRTRQAYACRVRSLPRCGYGKAHNIKINEHSCNFNWNKNYCKTQVLNNTEVYFPGERWVFVEPLGLRSCIAPLSKMPCFDLFSFPRISFQP